jgi:hypothetical protein
MDGSNEGGFVGGLNEAARNFFDRINKIWQDSGGFVKILITWRNLELVLSQNYLVLVHHNNLGSRNNSNDLHDSRLLWCERIMKSAKISLSHDIIFPGAFGMSAISSPDSAHRAVA